MRLDRRISWRFYLVAEVIFRVHRVPQRGVPQDLFPARHLLRLRFTHTPLQKRLRSVKRHRQAVGMDA
jgi:hypothetical protein